MNAPVQYSVVFNGVLVQGFEREAVVQTLAQKFNLEPSKAQQLFDGNKHTLKRTTSEDEARRVVDALATLGVVTRVESPAYAAQQPAVEEVEDKTPAKPAVFAPLKNTTLLKPLLFLVVGCEVILAGIYLDLVLSLIDVSFFTMWADGNRSAPLLMLMLQLFSLPFLALLLLLLLKPLLALQRQTYRGIRVPEEQETDLHMFVQDICERFQIEPPCEIRLNNDVQISLHHRDPLKFWRSQYVLTIGVPLLATLKVDQFAALLVREFYSLRHPQAPRASFLLLRINRWLHDTVHGDDYIDRKLRDWQEQERLSPGVVRVVQLLFTYSRKVFALRLWLSRLLGRALVQRLISDAGQQACNMASVDSISHALEQQLVIGQALQELIPKLQQQWNEKSMLPDDMVQLAISRSRQYPATIHNLLRQRQLHNKARSGDIFPGDAQLVSHLEQQQVRPSYHCMSPAIILLRYFAKLATTMTVRYYHNRLRIPVTPNKLIHPVAKGSAEDQLNKILTPYFGGVLQLMQPLGMQPLLQQAQANPRQQWQEALQQIKNTQAIAQKDFVSGLEIEKQLSETTLREVMLRAELWRKLGEGKPRKSDFEDLQMQCRNVEEEYEASLTRMASNMKPYAQRLTAALSLAGENDAEKRKQIEQMIALYTRIEAVLPQLREIKLTSSLLNILLSYRSSRRKQALEDRIQEEAADIQQLVTALKVALRQIPNPFPSPRGGKTLVEFLLLEAYEESSPEGEYDRGNEIVKQLGLIQKRILARLVMLAKEAEATLS